MTPYMTIQIHLKSYREYLRGEAMFKIIAIIIIMAAVAVVIVKSLIAADREFEIEDVMHMGKDDDANNNNTR